MRKVFIVLIIIINFLYSENSKQKVAVFNVVSENSYISLKEYELKLETELLNTGAFTVISKDVIDKIVTEMKADSAGFTIKDYKSIGNLSSVDYFITGLVRNKITIIKMIESKSGEIIKIVEVNQVYRKNQIKATKYIAEMLAFDKSNALEPIIKKQKEDIKAENDDFASNSFLCCVAVVLFILLFGDDPII